MLIVLLYSIPGFELQYDEPWDLLKLDKIVHMGMFSMMFLVLVIALRKQNHFASFQYHSRKIAFSVVLLFGATMEFFQDTFFVQRTSDLLDFIANAFGAVIGVLLFRMIYGKELAGL